MTLAAIDWLSIGINLMLVAFVIVCLLMTLLILMQRPKQEGLGAAFGGGVTDQVFGARTTNVLQRGTVYLGSLFFLLALGLAILIGRQNKQAKLLEDTAPPAEVQQTAEESPAVPQETSAPKSLAEELPVDEPAGSEVPAETPPATPAETAPTAPAETAPATPAETAPTAPASGDVSSDQPQQP